MGSLDSVFQKLHRYEKQFEELIAELAAYHKLGSGNWHQTEVDLKGDPIYEYRSRDPIPARFGLIVGECLQSLRSSLDYLVWELVLAAGNTPDRHNMFPISLRRKTYKDDLNNRHRLDGLTDAMKAKIDAFQPFHQSEPESTALTILDQLAITNRHRRVILTSLTAVAEEPISPFPRRSEIVRIWGDNGELWNERKFWIYIAVQEGTIQNMEVAVLLDAITRYIVDVVLPSFEQFFEC